MKITESKLRRTIRKAILINEGKKAAEKAAKKLAKKIKKYVNGQHEQNPIDAFETCNPSAIMEKYQELGKTENEIKAAIQVLDDDGYLQDDTQRGIQWFEKPR